MVRKFGLTMIGLSLILSGNVLGEGKCSGASNGSSGKAGGVKMMTFEKGDVTLIGELGSIIVSDDEGLVVQMAGPKEARTGKYKDVDLRDSDRIIMLNGKK